MPVAHRDRGRSAGSFAPAMLRPARDAGRRAAARARLSAGHLPRHAGVLIMIVLMMALRGSGDAMTPLWFMVVAVVLDSGLNPVFILGLGPAPELGIAGSAMATVIANYRQPRRPARLHLRARPAAAAARRRAALPAPDPALLRIDRRQGPADGPADDRHLLLGAGDDRAWSTARASTPPPPSAWRMQLWTYLQMPAMALGAAVSAMAAQNIGAGSWDRVSAITRSAWSSTC